MPVPVTITIANEPHSLRFNMGDMAFFEERSGLATLAEALSSKLGAKSIKWMLAAGLRHERVYKSEEIEALIDKHVEAGGTIADLIRGITKGLEAFGWRAADERPNEAV